MDTRIPLLLGVITGGALVARERKVQRSVERFAAAALETLLNAIEANDEQTGMHVRRVAVHAVIIAEFAGLERATNGRSNASDFSTTSARSTKPCSTSCTMNTA